MALRRKIPQKYPKANGWRVFLTIVAALLVLGILCCGGVFFVFPMPHPS